jgi:hypothetical protein
MTRPMGDGRTYQCDYCNTKVVAAITGDQVAEGMHLDLGNIDSFMAQLANTLYKGYAECTRIGANGNWVHTIEVNLDPDGFSVQRNGNSVTATYKKMVRGVALKNTVLPLDQWVKKLTDALARQASSNAKAAWVLAQLTGNQHTNVR